MRDSIVRRVHESDGEFFRRLGRVFTQRAGEQLRAGRNPEQAAMLAAEYHQRAAEAANALHAGER